MSKASKLLDLIEGLSYKIKTYLFDNNLQYKEIDNGVGVLRDSIYVKFVKDGDEGQAFRHIAKELSSLLGKKVSIGRKDDDYAYYSWSEDK